MDSLVHHKTRWKGAVHGVDTTYQISMLFRRDPEVSITPSAQVAKFLDLGMRVLDVVFHGKARRVIYADVAAKTPENAANFESEKFGIRAVWRQLRPWVGLKRKMVDQEVNPYRCLKLPYKTSTFSRDPVLMRSR